MTAGTQVRDLNIETRNGKAIVENVSLSIPPGEILGLVGESGSGKTTVGLALLGYCRSGLKIRSGSIRIGETEVLAKATAIDDLRGKVVFYMPQDPATALNPFLRVGTQLAETFRDRPDEAALRKSLGEVRLPEDGRILHAHAFELSGGQQQRIAIAMAFANRPRLIVMDEPTTGLDVTTQAHVLATIKALCREHGVSALYVSHDLAVVSQLANEVAVMRNGRIVETGPAREVLGTPKHEYTQALIKALPRLKDRAAPIVVEKPETLLSVRRLKAWHGPFEVLHGIDLDVPRGACVALVGESGSGKTTLSRCVAGLHAGLSGTISFRGQELQHAAADRPRDLRKRVQYIFQNPYSSLNPEHTIGRSIQTVIALFERVSRKEMADRVADALAQVSLPKEIANRYPRELSGGQRQRAAIARALAAEPELLICDEITSALDVSVQARVVELLQDLQRRRGLSMLFVTHNLPLVANIAQQILVMQAGNIVEGGNASDVLDQHRAEETRRLLRDTPDFTYEA
ncbi:MAG TPA: ABC transporter ATP-binding protein [Dongiaceae bacterium]|jgi:peptide/nickel transport system ATP-binding protein|nr:ABC transporter ATP-binding protein [Dongiaceae bacterium]